ncbi:MAG: hypothetical protein GY719_38810 [bacterium]|nr:hypothetical protein [bacterium]
MLVECGWITGEQLIRAIQSQRVVGGRIGTCLLEMDVLSEDQLLETLSVQLSVPSARIEELRSVQAEILDRLPLKVASRWQAVPFFANETDLRIATLNVKNLACLDEIEFCTNLRVLPHIANEVRIFEALERYYGVECPRRYGHLLDKLNRSRYMWDDDAKALLEAGEAEWLEPGEPKTAAEGNGDHELIQSAASRSTRKVGAPVSAATLDLSFSGQTSPTRPTSAETWPTGRGTHGGQTSPASTNGGRTPAPAVLTLEDVDHLLAGQADQRSIGKIMLSFLGQTFSRCAIFSIKNDSVRGWLHHGEGFDGALFRKLKLGLDQPSAFLSLAKGAEFFLGPLAPMPAHRALARCWGGDLPHQCLLMPVQLRGRLISILYGDRGARDLHGVEVQQIKRLSDKASIAFELCILRKKLQQKIVSS